MMLTGLADVLRAAGLSVVEEPGWTTRGHGEMTDVQTIICHHTAGPATGDLPSLRTVRDGRPGLDGPLAQLMLARSGVWHVIAAGVCWHAGVSLRTEYTNHHAIGIEAEATGVDPWPPIQYDSYVRGARALADHYGVPIDHVLGHKETCSPPGRKSDPNFDMDAFRADVLNTTTGDDDMPTPEEIARAVWFTEFGDSNPLNDLRHARDAAQAGSGRALAAIAAANERPDELAAAVAKALPQNSGLTQQQITAAFIDALKQLASEAQ